MAKKVIKIAPVEQYIIDRVREIRLKLNITAEKLSEKVSPSNSIGFVGNIESSAKAATYTDHNLNLIAAIFSKYAKELNDDSIQKDYTVYDFYPKEPLDDTPIIKRAYITPLSPGPTNTLNRVIEETDFFDIARSLKEITEYCNRFDSTERKTTSFTSPLYIATKNNRLERTDLKEGTVMYCKPKTKS